METADNHAESSGGLSTDTIESRLISHRLSHLLLLACVLLLAFMAYLGAFSGITDSLGGRYVDNISQSYIAAADKSSTELVEVLSASKVALAVLQSSKGGISFFIDIEVQLGQSLNVIYEMVDYAWLFTLASLAATKSMGVLLDLSDLSMAPVLTLFFCLMGFGIGLRRRLPAVALAISGMARYVLFAALMVHIVVPLAIYGVAATGHHFFQDHKSGIYDQFVSFHKTLPGHDSSSGLHSQVKGSITHFKDNQAALHKHTSELSNITIKHIVFIITEYLLAPVILLLALSFLFLLPLKRLWPEWERKLGLR